jgi:hypothetical protein
MQFRVSDHASTTGHLISANFELRFDQGDKVTLILQQSNKSGKNDGQRNEREVSHDDVHRSIDVACRHSSNVDSLAYRDPLVISNLRVKLTVPDIDGDNGSSTVLQEAIRKSTG